MRRCAIFRGSNTWRSLNTTTREGPATTKLQKLASWTVHDKDGHGRGTKSRRRASNQSDSDGKHSHDSVQLAGSPFEKPSAERTTQTSLRGNEAPPIEAEAQPLPGFPLSPLMDPEFQQAKERHTFMKQPPTELRTQLQQELAKNPFALALASPLRTCGLNSVTLPRYFLLDFKVLEHPTTEVPFFLPTSLTSKYARVDTTPSNKSESIMGLTAYTIANKQSLGMMQDPRSGYFKGRGGTAQRVHHTLIPRWMFEIKPIMKKLVSSRWRPDMEQFVLELLRRRCVERLVELANLKRGYLAGCADWEDATSKPSVGAFLWTGGNEADPSDAPADFATLDLGMEGGMRGGEKKRKRKVPVYNLRSLLGLEKLTELREQLPSGIFTRDVVAVKHKKMTVELQMHLWKMQGYVADFDKLFKIRRGLLEGRNMPEEEHEEDEGDDDFFGGDHGHENPGRY